jgi:hypothetical protein
MYPDIGIAGRISAADIKHRILIIAAVNAIGTSQYGMTAAVRTPGRSVLSSFLFHKGSSQIKKPEGRTTTTCKGNVFPLQTL